MGFEIYQDKAGEWRWRLRAPNGLVVANGGQKFASKQNAIRALDAVRKNVAESTEHVEVTSDEEG
jgi:uncharacterized protein